MQPCCHRHGRRSRLRLVAALLAHAVALAAAARIPTAVPLLQGGAESRHRGYPNNEQIHRLPLAGAARSLLAPATSARVLPASSSPSPSSSPCPPHENPAAPYIPCGASPSPSPSPSPDPTLGSGSIKNSCGQPITLQAAYEVISEEDGANCTELVPFYGPAASVFSELEPRGFLCLTGWEVIDPGETYQVPFATPMDLATGKQAALLTHYPRCRLHNLFDEGYCSHQLSWWYTAHIVTDAGTTYSLSRGKLGSSLRNGTDMQLCWPAVPEECVWWAPMEPVRIDYDAFESGPEYRPNLVEWGTEDALELTCPDFLPAQGGLDQDPGPLPSHMAPLVVENSCHRPIAFAAGFLLQQPFEQHPCRVVMQAGDHDAACVTDFVTIPEGETVQLDTIWKDENLARSVGLLHYPLPYDLKVSAYVLGSSPQHWLTNTSTAAVWGDVPTPGLFSGGAAELSTAMCGTVWTPLVKVQEETSHWKGEEYVAEPLDFNMTRADGTVVIRCEGYEDSE